MSSGRDTIIELLVRIAPLIIDSYSKYPNHCVMATSVGIEVLRRCHVYGRSIYARPLSVHMQIFNDSMKQWLDSGMDGGVEKAIEAGSHILETDVNPVILKPGFWGGHLMIELPGIKKKHQRKRSRLIELNAGQYTRPQKNINLPPGILFENFGGEDRYGSAEKGWIIIKARRDDKSYEDGPDWKNREERDDCVNEIIFEMKKVLHKGYYRTGD